MSARASPGGASPTKRQSKYVEAGYGPTTVSYASGPPPASSATASFMDKQMGSSHFSAAPQEEDTGRLAQLSGGWGTGKPRNMDAAALAADFEWFCSNAPSSPPLLALYCGVVVVLLLLFLCISRWYHWIFWLGCVFASIVCETQGRPLLHSKLRIGNSGREKRAF